MNGRPSARARWRAARRGLPLAALIACATLAAPTATHAVLPERVEPAYDRLHERGFTTLRFHKDRFHFALVLDAPPRETAPRHLVTAQGRRIPLHWSGRSVWIDHVKYELPFGAVFLVSTRDSVRVRQLDFNAALGRLVLDRAAAAPEAAEWLRARGGADSGVARGDVQAATYPRHTLELTEWTYRGLFAATCLVSGEPLFVLLSRERLDAGGSSQTMFGNLEHVDVHVGAGADRRTLRANATHVVFGDLTLELAHGRVFMLDGVGERLVQVDAGLEAGPAIAAPLADHIEELPDVRAHLGR